MSTTLRRYLESIQDAAKLLPNGPYQDHCWRDREEQYRRTMGAIQHDVKQAILLLDQAAEKMG